MTPTPAQGQETMMRDELPNPHYGGKRMPIMRGFSCVGLHRPKTPENVGGVLRAAHCYGVSQVVIEGARNEHIRHCTNTVAAHCHMPTILTDDMLASLPFDTQLVVVDLVEGATALPAFQHPQRAFYVFGPEDGTLGKRFTSRAQHVVYIPTRNCMNLAACVNVVLYDRMAKSLRDNAERLPKYALAALTPTQPPNPTEGDDK